MRKLKDGVLRSAVWHEFTIFASEMVGFEDLSCVRQLNTVTDVKVHEDFEIKAWQSF